MQALDGLKVIDMATVFAGPGAARHLADFGADVVKVERPDGGDDMREWPPILRSETGDAFSGNFASLNRNKRSLSADLKDPREVARLRELCSKADVVVENYRPGVLDRLGIGYETLKRHAPHLVYCSVSGYGQDGPYATRGAFDVVIQAISGIMSCTGEPGGGPVKCGVPVGDFVAGLYASYSILAAVMRARATGEGARIDCSMLGGLLGIAALQTSEYFGTGVPARPLGSAHPRNAPYQAFNASDRPIVVAAGNDKLWKEVCAGVGMPELLEDERFATIGQRARHQRELAARLEPAFMKRTAAHWLDEFDRRGVPSAPIHDFAEILTDPHVGHMKLVEPITLPNGVTTQTVGYPVKISGFDFEIRRRPPSLGEHSGEIVQEWLGPTYATN